MAKIHCGLAAGVRNKRLISCLWRTKMNDKYLMRSILRASLFRWTFGSIKGPTSLLPDTFPGLRCTKNALTVMFPPDTSWRAYSALPDSVVELVNCVCKCSRLTGYSAYSERSCAKFTVKFCQNVQLSGRAFDDLTPGTSNHALRFRTLSKGFNFVIELHPEILQIKFVYQDHLVN